ADDRSRTRPYSSSPFQPGAPGVLPRAGGKKDASVALEHLGKRNAPEAGVVSGIVDVAAVAREPDEVGSPLAQPAASGNQSTPFVSLWSTEEVDRRRSVAVRAHPRDLHQGNPLRSSDGTPDVGAVSQVLAPVFRGRIRGQFFGRGIPGVCPP